MPYAIPDVADLFSDAHSAEERTTRYEKFRGKLADSFQSTDRGEVQYIPGGDQSTGRSIQKIDSPVAMLERTIEQATLTKAMTPEGLASLQGELDRQKAVEADIVKDLSLTSPLSTGFVAYDLEAPAKLLVPRPTPLRNRVPRMPGVGLSRRFKRITGFSNSGVGGVANLRPAINDSSTMSAGSLTLRRGPKISYAADEKAIIYKQFGLSDIVTWSAEYQGRGFQDIRELSQTALLYASMLADELTLLGGRGTDTGYVGAISTPAAPTAAAATASASQTGNTANLAHVYIKVSAKSVFGETLPSTALDHTGLAAVTGKVVNVTITDVAGAVGYNVYVSSDNASFYYAGTTGCSTFAIQFTGGGTGGIINSGNAPLGAATDSSADEFDGFLAFLLDSSQSGYLKRLNAAFSTSAPGSEYQTAFAALYDVASGGVMADPDEILLNGIDRKQISEALKAGTTTPGYRLQIMQNEVDGVRLGSLVSHIVNEVTGKEVPFNIHPRMPQGNSLLLSWELPVPDSQVSNCFEYHLPQDYMGINWPVVQHTFDIGSYWLGALVPYAPKWSGAVCGIQAA